VSRSRAVERLIAAFARLPSIGPKTSERIAYHLLRGDGKLAEELADAIRAARASTRVCSVCFNLDETDPCAICADPERDRNSILVVEDPRDVSAFEQAGYRGLYHVLQGRLSPLEGVKPEELTVGPLLERLADGGATEVCLATNPDLEGEGTARVLAERLVGRGVRVTRLARGIPAGSTITQVSSAILADAIEGRRELS
jgi:recombination protein RecR